MVGFGPLASYPLAALPQAGISAELTATLADVTLASTGAVKIQAALTKTLDDAALSSTGAIALKAAASITLDDATLSSAGVAALKGAATISLSDLTLVATGAIQIKGAVAATLDDVVLIAVGDFLTTITDTEVLKLPINCVLAGQQPYSERGREWAIPPPRRTEKGSTMRSRVGRIYGGESSYTVRTSHRGYD